MAARISVVISQGQSANPKKRGLEEAIVARCMMEGKVDVTIIPHLYDLTSESTGALALQGIGGDLIVLSWLYERATRWVLDQHGIRGQVGTTLLQREGENEEDSEEGGQQEKEETLARRDLPHRTLWCIDLGASESPDDFIEEIDRIASEASRQVVDLTISLNGNAKNEGAAKLDSKITIPLPLNGKAKSNASEKPPAKTEVAPTSPEKSPARRWYPVIDYSRCTNCMECIDFCLFGVYGVDSVESILVEQPDECRKGCPACSRICPENAILFPQHKSPAIAGSLVGNASVKIDLSQLFGAPQSGKSAAELAALERDEQLLLAGREAVDKGPQTPVEQEEKQESNPVFHAKDETESHEKIELRNTTEKPATLTPPAGTTPISSEHEKLDALMDGLDALDL